MGAIALQAALFVVPNGLAALALPPLPGIVYAVGYSFVCVGVVGGWAAWRTGSIFPSLLTQTLLNLALTAIILP
jgi:hypothetical protein